MQAEISILIPFHFPSYSIYNLIFSSSSSLSAIKIETLNWPIETIETRKDILVWQILFLSVSKFEITTKVVLLQLLPLVGGNGKSWKFRSLERAFDLGSLKA